MNILTVIALIEKALQDLRAASQMHSGAGAVQSILQQLVQQLWPILQPIIAAQLQAWLQQILSGKAPAPPSSGSPGDPVPGWGG